MPMREYLQSDPSKTYAPPSARPPHAPGIYVGYDPLLVGRMRAEQQRILVLFAQAQALLTTHDYAGVKHKLNELRVTLQDHLMTANVKFYVYVSRYLAGDAAKSAIIGEYRREMLVSSRKIMDFLRTYSTASFDDNLANTFQVGLLVISAALVERVEREQVSLYPLYQASY